MIIEKKIDIGSEQLNNKVLFLLTRDIIQDDSKFSVIGNNIIADKFIVGNIVERFDNLVKIEIVDSVWSSLFLELINELKHTVYKNCLIFYIDNIEDFLS